MPGTVELGKIGSLTCLLLHEPRIISERVLCKGLLEARVAVVVAVSRGQVRERGEGKVLGCYVA